MDAAVSDSISRLANILTIIQINVNSERPLNQVWGSDIPSVTRSDMLKRVEGTIARLQMVISGEMSAAQRDEIVQSPDRISFLETSLLPQIQNNPGPTIRALYDELDRLDRAFPPPSSMANIDWEKLVEDGYLPQAIARRLRGMETRLNKIDPDLIDVEAKMSLIKEAYRTAELLPETQLSLEHVLAEIVATRTQAQSYASESATHEREAAELKRNIEDLALASAEKFDELEDAYRAAATKGLASSFQKRADSLTTSVQLWVGALATDLVAGAYIGILRFSDLQAILASKQTSAIIWGNLVFSALSLAAPVWFAWVATKQIAQRFKLAEDYGFKATVASAYEAWKSEARKQDEDFGKRLFSSALSRLEEPPGRFMETETYGSPWHELTSSPAFGRAMDKVPELQTILAKIITGAGGAAAGAAAVLSSASAQKRDSQSDKDASSD